MAQLPKKKRRAVAAGFAGGRPFTVPDVGRFNTMRTMLRNVSDDSPNKAVAKHPDFTQITDTGDSAFRFLASELQFAGGSNRSGHITISIADSIYSQVRVIGFSV